MAFWQTALLGLVALEIVMRVTIPYTALFVNKAIDTSKVSSIH